MTTSRESPHHLSVHEAMSLGAERQMERQMQAAIARQPITKTRNPYEGFSVSSELADLIGSARWQHQPK